MNIVIQLDQYNKNYLHLCTKTQNHLLKSGFFHHLLYITPLLTFRGLYIEVPLQIKEIRGSKCFIQYDTTLLCQLNQIENDLLQLLKVDGKEPEYLLYKQLLFGYIRTIPIYQSKSIILRISGIWEADHSYGITFKFLL